MSPAAKTAPPPRPHEGLTVMELLDGVASDLALALRDLEIVGLRGEMYTALAIARDRLAEVLRRLR